MEIKYTGYNVFEDAMQSIRDGDNLIHLAVAHSAYLLWEGSRDKIKDDFFLVMGRYPEAVDWGEIVEYDF